MHDGLAHVDAIVAREATARGWPPDIAKDYLLRLLKLEIDLSRLATTPGDRAVPLPGP